MEEAKDIRELKSLLSGLSTDDDTRHSPAARERMGADANAQKIALLKSLSVLLFALSLFLFLSLLWVLARGYLAAGSSDHVRQTMAASDAPKAVPAITEPAPEVTKPPVPASPTVAELAVLPAPAVSDPPVPPSPAVSRPDRGEPAPAATSAHRAARTVVLKDEGGSLYFIAVRHYGKADETIFDLILQANPAIADVRNIDDRQHITLPSITAESYIRGSVPDGYRVYVGTFETPQWADIYAARVTSTGKHAFIEPRQFSERDTWYRLMIGDFKHKEDALQTVRDLVKAGVIYVPPHG